MASKTILLLLVVLFMFPVCLGIGAAIFGIFAGIVGAIFGVISGIFGAIFGIIGGIFGCLFHWNMFTGALIIVAIFLIARSRKL